MAVAITGSTTKVTFTASGSQSVTIPSDTELCLLLAGGYGATNYLDGGVAQDASITGLTLGGTAFKLAYSMDDSSTYNESIIAYYKSPPTGTPSFAWSIGTYSYGTFYIVCLKSVATSSYIKARGGAQDFTSASSGSMSASTGDMCLAVVGVDSLGSWTGATAYDNDGTHSAIGTATPSADITVTYGSSNNPGLSAVVIAAGAAAPAAGTWGLTVTFT